MVLSAYWSLFRGARERRLTLRRNDPLWPLLVKIALNKLRHRAREHEAAKRSVHKEQRAGYEPARAAVEYLSDDRQPPRDAVVALTEEVGCLLDALKPRHRQIVTRWLAGCTTAAIARELGCTERAVPWLLRTRLEPDLRQRLLDQVGS